MGLTTHDTLSTILDTFRLQVEIINNAQFCGDWAIDTSGTRDVSFHLVVHGDCVVTSEMLKKPECLSPGDFVMFPHDAPHRLESSLACAAELNQQEAIGFDQGLANDGVGLLCGYFRFTHPVNNPLIDVLPEVLIKRRAVDNGNSLIQLLDFIQAESLSPSPGSQAAINRTTESLFILILREFISKTEQTTGLAAAIANPKLVKALDAIHTQPEHKWSVEKLASLSNMSRSVFAEQFKKYLNESPIEYLTRWRMQNAWRWLQEENVSVLEIAERCGYETEAAFAKAFKRIVGIGPGEARKK